MRKCIEQRYFEKLNPHFLGILFVRGSSSYLRLCSPRFLSLIFIINIGMKEGSVQAQEGSGLPSKK